MVNTPTEKSPSGPFCSRKGAVHQHRLALPWLRAWIRPGWQSEGSRRTVYRHAPVSQGRLSRSFALLPHLGVPEF